jgi:hypothetical protein
MNSRRTGALVLVAPASSSAAAGGVAAPEASAAPMAAAVEALAAPTGVTWRRGLRRGSGGVGAATQLRSYR